MDWKIVEGSPQSAEANMAKDVALLGEAGDPTVHFYNWERRAATFGYFTPIERWLSLEAVARHGLDVARRPTGGGVVFHEADLAFAVVVPATSRLFSKRSLDNYALVNSAVGRALRRLLGKEPELLGEDRGAESAGSRHFCMARPTIYDVMLEGKKVGGAALRQKAEGFLYQGTLSLGLLPEAYLCDLLVDQTIYAQMRKNSYFLLGESWTPEALAETRRALKALLITALCEGGDA